MKPKFKCSTVPGNVLFSARKVPDQHDTLTGNWFPPVFHPPRTVF